MIRNRVISKGLPFLSGGYLYEVNQGGFVGSSQVSSPSHALVTFIAQSLKIPFVVCRFY